MPYRKHAGVSTDESSGSFATLTRGPLGGARLVASDESGRAQAVAVVRLVAREFALSNREAEVLAAAAWGRSTKETAADLYLSAKTIEYYWKQILDKFSRRSRLEVMSLLFRRACDVQASAAVGLQTSEQARSRTKAGES
jgi:DNA-binding CsgD family transcriptional regulator